MSNQHTPEPWVFDQQAEIPHVMTPDGYAIVEACPWGSISDQETMSANARRIVACVNACAWIDTEYLEREQYLGTASFAMRDAAEKQRDELLAALLEIRLLASYERGTEDANIHEIARAAITKVKS